MVIFFSVLVVLVCVCLGFFILIQNPKGGGLSGNVGGVGNQLMGVKQTTDVLEKGTWIFASALVILALTSVMFLKTKHTAANEDKSLIQQINTSQPAAPRK